MAGRSESTSRSASRSMPAGVAAGLRRRAVAPRSGEHRLVERDLAVEDVARDLEVARSGSAREALPRRHRHHVGDPLGRGDAGGELGDRAHHVDVGKVLQAAHAVLALRGLAADVQHRALGAKRGGDAGHRVGAARTRGGDHAAQAPGLARVPVGGVGRHLLVAHVHHPDALVDAPVVDVDDVAAAEREDGVDPFTLQRLRHEVSAGHHVLVAALLREGVLGGARPRGGLSLVHCHVAIPRLEAARRDSRRRWTDGLSRANRRSPPRVSPGSGCARAPSARRARHRVPRAPR